MSEEQTIRNVLMTKESRIPTLGAYTLTLLLLVTTVGDFVGDLRTTAEFTSNTPEWNITFEIQNQSLQTVETLQDDETRNVLFELSEIDVPEGYTIGSIDVTITSEEDGGVSVQCDSIAGDIIENDLMAQWNDPASNLSGQDSSCVPIELHLRVYPNFDGKPTVISAVNAFQALEPWTETGWGVGVLSVDLELDVNTPLGFADPIGLDTDEEITVDVTVTMFKASLSLVE
tara:strand:- start:2350 stop:3039 length:690 start_codon:yes stop_codon:yes gene_type:complete